MLPSWLSRKSNLQTGIGADYPWQSSSARGQRQRHKSTVDAENFACGHSRSHGRSRKYIRVGIQARRTAGYDEQDIGAGRNAAGIDI
jgi:hypothetical protein